MGRYKRENIADPEVNDATAEENSQEDESDKPEDNDDSIEEVDEEQAPQQNQHVPFEEVFILIIQQQFCFKLTPCDLSFVIIRLLIFLTKIVSDPNHRSIGWRRWSGQCRRSTVTGRWDETNLR